MIAHILLQGGPAWIFVRLVTVIFTALAVFRLMPVPDRQQPHYKPRPWRGTLRYGASLGALALAATGCVAVAHQVSHHPSAPVVTAAPTVTTRTTPPAGPLIGMFANGVATSYTPVQQFAHATGVTPNVVLAYSNASAPFNIGFANRAHAHGATPFIQLMPDGVSMKDVAAGRLDVHLRASARLVKAFGHQVILGFASEPNGSWYPWGFHHTSPQTWVAAWRHVVTVFREAGAVNVTWLWDVNIDSGLRTATGPIRDWWPGSKYVTWVGMDGYYIHPHATFSSVFGHTLSAVRRLTAKPVMIGEVGIGPVSGQARSMPGLFAGARHHHLLGLVYFDVAQHQGLFHQDWRLEGRKPALRAFHAGLRSLRAG